MQTEKSLEMRQLRGQELYHHSILPALYESSFTVSEFSAGYERTFDFFSYAWRAQLTPKRARAYPVEIYLKCWVPEKRNIPFPPSAATLMAPVDRSLQHPWVLKHLQSGDPAAALSLSVRLEFNGTRDRLGLGFYLHHLDLKRKPLESETDWEKYELTLTHKSFSFWLNQKTGTLAYREYPGPEAPKITLHEVNALGFLLKTQTFEPENRSFP